METNTNKKSISTATEILSLLKLIAIALVIRIFLVEPFFVPTGSMKNTIIENDYIFSTKYTYGYSKHSFPFSPNIFSGRIFASDPARGDIVIFRPPHNMDIRYIKRLVGLPGDKIQLINDIIYINDKAIEREEIGECSDDDGQRYRKYRETLPNGVSYFSYKHAQNDPMLPNHRYSTTETFHVPQDKYFFLGDNRDASNDSRIELGFVPFENFIAKGQFILFSTKEQLWVAQGKILERVTRIWTWLCSIRFNRIFKSLYSLDG